MGTGRSSHKAHGPTCLPACADRFYDKAHKLDALDFFKRFAVNPDELPDTVFASIGRTVWRDIGPTAICFRILTKARACVHVCVWVGGGQAHTPLH